MDEPGQRDIADNLVAALKGDQFILYAQPIAPLLPRDDQTSYQEILVRFAEEEKKLLPPGGFFPTLERLKLMATLDKWVINRVLRWFVAKRKAAPTAWSKMCCSINLSTDSILGAGFVEFVTGQLKQSNVPAENILFEISEQDADKYALELDQFVMPLKPLGCRFVITGYSGELVSQEMLQALGINLLKIDGGIVRRIHEHQQSFDEARSIHDACRDIGIRTVAELVESSETLDRLKEIGVDYAQGYGISKPAPLN
jgi:EAL domain-containing protein (putative c-di-GMP-specific phosphodiesterase class I)